MDVRVGVRRLGPRSHERTRRQRAEDELHLWSFDDAGRVSGYQHFVDTAKHIEAAREALVV